MKKPVPHDVPAISRADQILHLIANSKAPVKVATLVQHLKIARSTLYLLLESMTHRRWIEKCDGGYIIGLGLYSLGLAYARRDGLRLAFARAAAKFVRQHNEVVQLAMLDGTDVVYIAREDAQRPVRLVSDLGSRLPAHACALGKAMLARMDDAVLLELLPEQLPQFTPHTTSRRATLLADLQTVRSNGYALDEEEIAEGLICFAAYVGKTATGRAVAVSTSIPRARLEANRRAQIIQGIKTVARDIAVATASASAI